MSETGTLVWLEHANFRSSACANITIFVQLLSASSFLCAKTTLFFLLPDYWLVDFYVLLQKTDGGMRMACMLHK